MKTFKNLLFAVVAVSVGLSSPAFAAETTTTNTSTSTPTTTQESNASGVATGGGYSFDDTDGCCKRYYDYSHANENAKGVVGNIRQSIAALQLAIIEAMRLGTGQLSGNLREQSGAEHNLADQVDDRKVVQATEQARMTAIRSSENAVSTCQMTFGSRGGGTDKNVANIRQALANELTDYMKAEEGPGKDSPSLAMQTRLQAHCDKFGSAYEVEIGICAEEASKELANADMKASGSLYFAKDGVVSGYDKDRSAAATAFITHVTGRQIFDQFDEGKAKTSEGREEYAIRTSYLARNSLADEALANIKANREPSKDNQLVDWGNGTVVNMKGYEGANFKDGMAKHDWLKVMAKNFLYDSTSLGTSDTNEITALKHIKNMTAVQTTLQFEQYEMLERISGLLAAQLAILNDNTRTDLITR